MRVGVRDVLSQMKIILFSFELPSGYETYVSNPLISSYVPFSPPPKVSAPLARETINPNATPSHLAASPHGPCH